MVLEVIFSYVASVFDLAYGLLNNSLLGTYVGANPFWILVAVFASSAIIAIACRLSVSLFAERSGGS